MEINAEPLPISDHSLPQSDESVIRDAVTLISEATHPIILAGNGITRCQATTELKAIAEKADIPVVHSFMGKGALSWKHDLSLLTAGISGKDHITCGFEKSDLIIPIGFDMAETPPQNWNPTGTTPILHIDTEEAEIDAHYPVKLHVVGNIKENLKQLVNLIPNQTRDLQWAHAIRKDVLHELEQYKQDDGFPVKPQKIIADLREAMNDEDIVISDVGAHKMWMARMYHTAEPNTCLISNGLASMGVAVPGAIAAKMAAPDRNVVAVCGDGAFLMNGAELETAVRLNVPIIILLWRDDGYGLIEWHQRKKFDRPSYIEFGNPDFIKLAESFGFNAIKIDSATDLSKALEKAVQLNKPVLIDCPVDYKENMKLTETLKNISCE
jgi:acetolactate synthase I/II/III large subunit